MNRTRLFLLIVTGSVAALGAGLIVLAGGGDASVTATTGSIHAALAKAGLEDQVALRDDLYAAVLRLKTLWGIVSLSGFILIFLGLVGLGLAWRSPR